MILFDNFSLIEQFSLVVEFKKGEEIIQEGGSAYRLYIIKEGQVVIGKIPERSREESFIQESKTLCEYISFKHLQAGSFIGEAEYFNHKCYGQSVTAKTDYRLYQINYEDLKELKNKNPKEFIEFLEVMGSHVKKRLRQSNNFLVNTIVKSHKRKQAREYYISVLLRIAIYSCAVLVFFTYFSQIYHEGNMSARTSLTVVLYIIMCLVIFTIKKRPNLKFFGVTRSGWWQSVKEGILASILLITIVIIIKWLYLQGMDEFSFN